MNLTQKMFVLLITSATMLPLIYPAAEVASGPLIPFGVCSRQGRRRSMEDTDVARAPFDEKKRQGFFAVYDGHGGAETAEVLATGLRRTEQSDAAETVDQFFEDLDAILVTHSKLPLPNAAAEEVQRAAMKVILPLHEMFGRLQTEYKSPVVAFNEAFRITEAQLFERTTTESGSTAIAAFIDLEAKMLTLANLGDSRAVFVQGEKLFATTDHKPDAPEEKKRIEEQGGWIGYPYGRTNVDGTKRPAYLNSSLAVSRAFGNHKYEFRPSETDPTRSFAYKTKLKALSTQPDISLISLTGEPAFLILACDGVWDVYSNEEAAGIVSDALNSAPDSLIEEYTPALPGRAEVRSSEGNFIPAEHAARTLRDAAYNKGSHDNITVLVALLNKTAELFPTEFTAAELPIISSDDYKEQGPKELPA